MKWAFLKEVDYISALKIQNCLRNEILESKREEIILLLEHPSTYTIGRIGSFKDIHLNFEERIRRGIRVFWTDRGGGTTYHGKGQLICYPLLSLEKYKISVKDFIKKLGEIVIEVLKELKIEASYNEKAPGVYVNEKKICSIGIYLKNSVVTHGLALNINCELLPFKWITPCCNEEIKMTSITEILGKSIEVSEIIPIFISKFGKSFNVEMEEEQIIAES